MLKRKSGPKNLFDHGIASRSGLATMSREMLYGKKNYREAEQQIPVRGGQVEGKNREERKEEPGLGMARVPMDESMDEEEYSDFSE